MEKVQIHDIAKITGYSVTTVSKALNGYTDISQKAKTIILKTAKEAGYFPNSSARSLVTRRSYTIGVVFEEETGAGITHPFFSHVLNHFKKYVEVEGYDILLISNNVGNQINSYLSHCQQKGVDGILILSSYLYGEGIQQLLESNVPSVIIDFDTDKTSCVYTDNFDASYQSVKYLYEKGHSKIGYIHGDLNNYSGSVRMNGYQQAMKDLKLEMNEEHIFSGPSYSIEEGYRAGISVASMKNKPTAICCASDSLAIGFMKAMVEKEMNVPNDLSIIGFDDIELANLVYPGLTTIRQDTQELAVHAAKLLFDEMANKDAIHDKVVVEGKLIERGTVSNLN